MTDETRRTGPGLQIFWGPQDPLMMLLRFLPPQTRGRSETVPVSIDPTTGLRTSRMELEEIEVLLVGLDSTFS